MARLLGRTIFEWRGSFRLVVSQILAIGEVFPFSMYVGVLMVKLHISESQSLKNKRGVVTSVVTRLRNTYNISVSEIDTQELWQLATLGIACTGSQVSYINELLHKVVDSISRNRFGAEILDCQMEIMSAF